MLNGRLSWQVGRAHGLDEGVAGLAVRGVHLKVRWIHRLQGFLDEMGESLGKLEQVVFMLSRGELVMGWVEWGHKKFGVVGILLTWVDSLGLTFVTEVFTSLLNAS